MELTRPLSIPLVRLPRELRCSRPNFPDDKHIDKSNESARALNFSEVQLKMTCGGTANLHNMETSVYESSLLRSSSHVRSGTPGNNSPKMSDIHSVENQLSFHEYSISSNGPVSEKSENAGQMNRESCDSSMGRCGTSPLTNERSLEGLHSEEMFDMNHVSVNRSHEIVPETPFSVDRDQKQETEKDDTSVFRNTVDNGAEYVSGNMSELSSNERDSKDMLSEDVSHESLTEPPLLTKEVYSENTDVVHEDSSNCDNRPSGDGISENYDLNQMSHILPTPVLPGNITGIIETPCSVGLLKGNTDRNSGNLHTPVVAEPQDHLQSPGKHCDIKLTDIDDNKKENGVSFGDGLAQKDNDRLISEAALVDIDGNVSYPSEYDTPVTGTQDTCEVLHNNAASRDPSVDNVSGDLVSNEATVQEKRESTTGDANPVEENTLSDQSHIDESKIPEDDDMITFGNTVEPPYLENEGVETNDILQPLATDQIVKQKTLTADGLQEDNFPFGIVIESVTSLRDMTDEDKDRLTPSLAPCEEFAKPNKLTEHQEILNNVSQVDDPIADLNTRDESDEPRLYIDTGEDHIFSDQSLPHSSGMSPVEYDGFSDAVATSIADLECSYSDLGHSEGRHAIWLDSVVERLSSRIDPEAVPNDASSEASHVEETAVKEQHSPIQDTKLKKRKKLGRKKKLARRAKQCPGGINKMRLEGPRKPPNRRGRNKIVLPKVKGKIGRPRKEPQKLTPEEQTSSAVKTFNLRKVPGRSCLMYYSPITRRVNRRAGTDKIKDAKDSGSKSKSEESGDKETTNLSKPKKSLNLSKKRKSSKHFDDKGKVPEKAAKTEKVRGSRKRRISSDVTGSISCKRGREKKTKPDTPTCEQILARELPNFNWLENKINNLSKNKGQTTERESLETFTDTKKETDEVSCAEEAKKDLSAPNNQTHGQVVTTAGTTCVETNTTQQSPTSASDLYICRGLIIVTTNNNNATVAESNDVPVDLTTTDRGSPKERNVCSKAPRNSPSEIDYHQSKREDEKLANVLEVIADEKTRMLKAVELAPKALVTLKGEKSEESKDNVCKTKQIDEGNIENSTSITTNQNNSESVQVKQLHKKLSHSEDEIKKRSETGVQQNSTSSALGCTEGIKSLAALSKLADDILAPTNATPVATVLPLVPEKQQVTDQVPVKYIEQGNNPCYGMPPLAVVPSEKSDMHYQNMCHGQETMVENPPGRYMNAESTNIHSYSHTYPTVQAHMPIEHAHQRSVRPPPEQGKSHTVDYTSKKRVCTCRDPHVENHFCHVHGTNNLIDLTGDDKDTHVGNEYVHKNKPRDTSPQLPLDLSSKRCNTKLLDSIPRPLSEPGGDRTFRERHHVPVTQRQIQGQRSRDTNSYHREELRSTQSLGDQPVCRTDNPPINTRYAHSEGITRHPEGLFRSYNERDARGRENRSESREMVKPPDAFHCVNRRSHPGNNPGLAKPQPMRPDAVRDHHNLNKPDRHQLGESKSSYSIGPEYTPTDINMSTKGSTWQQDKSMINLNRDGLHRCPQEAQRKDIDDQKQQAASFRTNDYTQQSSQGRSINSTDINKQDPAHMSQRKPPDLEIIGSSPPGSKQFVHLSRSGSPCTQLRHLNELISSMEKQLQTLHKRRSELLKVTEGVSHPETKINETALNNKHNPQNSQQPSRPIMQQPKEAQISRSVPDHRGTRAVSQMSNGSVVPSLATANKPQNWGEKSMHKRPAENRPFHNYQQNESLQVQAEPTNIMQQSYPVQRHFHSQRAVGQVAHSRQNIVVDPRPHGPYGRNAVPHRIDPATIHNQRLHAPTVSENHRIAQLGGFPSDNIAPNCPVVQPPPPPHPSAVSVGNQISHMPAAAMHGVAVRVPVEKPVPRPAYPMTSRPYGPVRPVHPGADPRHISPRGIPAQPAQFVPNAGPQNYSHVPNMGPMPTMQYSAPGPRLQYERHAVPQAIPNAPDLLMPQPRMPEPVRPIGSLPTPNMPVQHGPLPGNMGLQPRLEEMPGVQPKPIRNNLPGNVYQDHRQNQQKRGGPVNKPKGRDDGKGSCTMCGSQAVYLCSGCRKTWYCSRKCQVDMWPRHREMCNSE